MTCKDCGKPIRRTTVPCAECGQRTWYHLSSADSLACPGGSGPHVQPAQPGDSY